MAQSWNYTANGHNLPPNAELENKNDALLPRRFTKAMIIALVLSGVVVVGLQVSNQCTANCYT